MKIEFTAELVTCDEVLDGDIIQISFQQDATEPPHDSTDINEVLESMSKYLSLSINYEFSPRKPSVEWYDGEEFNGGYKILNYQVDKTHFELQLENGVHFHISCDINEDIIGNINKILKDI